MGAVKKATRSVGKLLTKGFTDYTVIGQMLQGDDKEATNQVDPAAELENEEEIKRKARQMAVSDLNPTGTLGAGKAQTTRSKVLGV